MKREAEATVVWGEEEVVWREAEREKSAGAQRAGKAKVVVEKGEEEREAAQRVEEGKVEERKAPCRRSRAFVSILGGCIVVPRPNHRVSCMCR